ncbi:hypothetical protein [Marinicella sp. W31]|uniref:hypothetical protein n=1 Tax=Marinicella sp. W31 TaxID=3023713 RepID=UPI0037569F27
MAEQAFREDPKNDGISYTDKMFCEYAGISPSAYSQLKNPNIKPNFNELFARRIEKNTKQPIGWFDIDHEHDNFDYVQLTGEHCKIAILEFHRFMSKDIISINDDKKLNQMVEELIKHINKHGTVKESDFFEFLK